MRKTITRKTSEKRPLEGIRVLDASHTVAGPYCTMLMADLGAEVIKVERPGSGDMSRELRPFLKDSSGKSYSGRFLSLNRNKKSLTLDLKQEEGKKIFKKLVKLSDVVLESFKPGVMEKLGLGYQAIRRMNPAIVYASITGFGHPDVKPSPFWDRPAFDVIALAMGGLMDLTGDPNGPPQRPGGVPLGDIFPGTIMAFAILAALFQAKKTGIGQHVDVAMYDCIVSLIERPIAMYSIAGELETRTGGRMPVPYGAFKAKDGYVIIGALGPEMWVRLCKAIERTDFLEHPLFQNSAERYRNYPTHFEPILEDWASKRTIKEIIEIMDRHSVPASPVYNVKDIFECPHIAARNMLPEIEHPILGKMRLAGNPIKMSGVREEVFVAGPSLGENSREILRSYLNFSEKKIGELEKKGVI